MIKSQRPAWRLAFLSSSVALTLGLMGCGGGPTGVDPNLVSVTGKVTLDGKPLTSGDISYVSADTPGVGFGSAIDSSGNYALVQSVSAKGALPGTYKVIVNPSATGSAMGAGGEVTKVKSPIPEKYNKPDTTDIPTVMVEKGKSLVKNVELKSM
jgi:hypothetical protein